MIDGETASVTDLAAYRENRRINEQADAARTSGDAVIDPALLEADVDAVLASLAAFGIIVTRTAPVTTGKAE